MRWNWSDPPDPADVHDETVPLAYRAPDASPDQAGPGGRVWLALVLYGLAMVTPATVQSNQSRVTGMTWGWEAAFEFIADLPRAFAGGGTQSIPSIAIPFWLAAYLVLGIRRRWSLERPANSP